jgi:hypothetical protein
MNDQPYNTEESRCQASNVYGLVSPALAVGIGGEVPRCGHERLLCTSEASHFAFEVLPNHLCRECRLQEREKKAAGNGMSSGRRFVSLSALQGL